MPPNFQAKSDLTSNHRHNVQAGLQFHEYAHPGSGHRQRGLNRRRCLQFRASEKVSCRHEQSWQFSHQRPMIQCHWNALHKPQLRRALRSIDAIPHPRFRRKVLFPHRALQSLHSSLKASEFSDLTLARRVMWPWVFHRVIQRLQ